jgi:hypothetical protein
VRPSSDQDRQTRQAPAVNGATGFLSVTVHPSNNRNGISAALRINRSCLVAKDLPTPAIVGSQRNRGSKPLPEEVNSREPGLLVPSAPVRGKQRVSEPLQTPSKVCGAPKKLSSVWRLTPPAFSAARPTPLFHFAASNSTPSLQIFPRETEETFNHFTNIIFIRRSGSITYRPHPQIPHDRHATS